MNMTDKEVAMIRIIEETANRRFDGIDSIMWTSEVTDGGYCNQSLFEVTGRGKSLSALIGSLIKKGILINSTVEKTDDCINFTQTGLNWIKDNLTV